MWRILTAMLLIVVPAKAVPQGVKAPVEKQKITVMVIDTGIDATHPLVKDFVTSDGSDDYVPSLGHGTHVAGIILHGNKMFRTMDGLDGRDSVCPEVQLISCKYYAPGQSGQSHLAREVNCIERAIRMKADFINISGGGTEFSVSELQAVRAYTAQGGTIFAAAGNESSNMEKEPYYPASYGFTNKVPKVYAVQNVRADGRRGPTSNTHPYALTAVGTDVWSALPNGKFGQMTGTSQATPSVLHLFLKQKCADLYQKR